MDLFNLLRDNFQAYIGCSSCSKLTWTNDTRLACQLPSLNGPRNSTTDSTSSFACEGKTFTSILAKLNNQNQLGLIHFFVGNYEVQQSQDFAFANQNLKIYLQTYMMNNVDDYASLALALSRQASSSVNTQDLLKYSQLNSNAQLKQNSPESVPSRNLLLISAVISALLILLIVFTVVLVTIILKTKLNKNNLSVKNNSLDGSKCLQNDLNSLVMIRKSQKVSLLNKGALSLTNASHVRNKSEKQLKVEYEKIKQQIDQLELTVRPKCTQLFQLLHQDYINDLNNDLLIRYYFELFDYFCTRWVLIRCFLRIKKVEKSKKIYNSFCEKVTSYAYISVYTRIYDQTISLDFNNF